MVRHIIQWDHLEGLTPEQEQHNAVAIKEALENLVGAIPGLIELKVYTKLLPTSNTAMILDSTFESPEALKVYSDHPLHVKAATEVVRPHVRNRRCADFIFN